MSDVVELGSFHGRMCGHLAAAAGRFFAEITRNDPEVQVGIGVPHLDVSSYKDCELALLAVGILERPDTVPRRAPVFVMNAEDMPDFLAVRLNEHDERVPTLLATTLEIACAYDSPVLSTERAWFVPQPRWAVAMQWLARCGYAEQREGQFRWLDPIAPAMIANYSWTADGQSEATVLKEAADIAWTTMPGTLRRAILDRQLNYLDFAEIVHLSWRDGRWHPFRRETSVSRSRNLDLAGLIFERAGIR